MLVHFYKLVHRYIVHKFILRSHNRLDNRPDVIKSDRDVSNLRKPTFTTSILLLLASKNAHSLMPLLIVLTKISKFFLRRHKEMFSCVHLGSTSTQWIIMLSHSLPPSSSSIIGTEKSSHKNFYFSVLGRSEIDLHSPRDG